MKIDELKKAIRGIVRDEVKRAVAEEVSKAMGKVLVEMVKEIKSNPNQPRIVEESTEEDITTDAPVLRTNNPKLNGVLAETARKFRPIPREAGAGLAELMDGGFDKIGHGDMGIESQPAAPATKLDFLREMVGQTAAPPQTSVLDGGAEIPDSLKKVFKKDFRAVMKKMDEQKKGFGGGFNPLMNG